jgi:hypothetical protein
MTTTTIESDESGNGDDTTTYSDESLPEHLLAYTLPNSYTIYQNETGTFQIKVKNEGSSSLNNLKIDILGISDNSYSISPINLDYLSPNDFEIFTVTINPLNIIPGKYTLNIKILSDELEQITYSTLTIKEYTRKIGEMIEEQERIESEVKPVISFLRPILAGVIVTVIIVAAIMLQYIKNKTCPFCGGKVVKEYTGDNFTSYKCSNCAYYRTKIKKVKNKGISS